MMRLRKSLNVIRRWLRFCGGLPPMTQNGMLNPSPDGLTQQDLFAAIANAEPNAIAAEFSNETVPPPAQMNNDIQTLKRQIARIEEFLR